MEKPQLISRIPKASINTVSHIPRPKSREKSKEATRTTTPSKRIEHRPRSRSQSRSKSSLTSKPVVATNKTKSATSMADRRYTERNDQRYSMDTSNLQTGNSRSRESSRYRTGLLHDTSADLAYGTATPQTQMSRTPPGTDEHRHSKLTEDLLFSRPNTTIPISQQRPASASPNWARINNNVGNFGYQHDHRNSLQSQPQPKTYGLNYKNSFSTNEELNRMLAKYSPHAIPPHPNEYQVYQATIPGSGNYPTAADQFVSSFRKSQENLLEKYGTNPIRDMLNPTNKQKKDDVGIFGLPLEKVDGINSNSRRPRRSKSLNSFPFRETAEGDFLIYPEQVAFESKAISVIVADPLKIGIIKGGNLGDLIGQEHLLSEVEDVIQKSLSKYYDKHIQISLTDASNDDRARKAKDDLFSDKEFINMKYTDAKAGTEKLMIDIHHRLRAAKHADTHVVIGDTVYPCHSVALEVVSKYFDNLSRPKDTIRRIKLPESDVPSSIFPTLMDWILQTDHGRASVMRKENVIPLYSAAKHLEISELKSQCITYLQEKLETNDRYLMPLWEEVKKRPNCQELMRVISSKAAASFRHIYKEKQYINLDVSELVMLLSSDDIVIDSELDVFNTCVTWLLHNWEVRKVHTNEIINTVRFGLLTPLQLTTISHSPELAKGAKCPHEYPELLSYGSVKSMIDDGLAYSIVNESYQNEPTEIAKWVDSTGIKAPRLRTHTNTSVSRSKSFVIPTTEANDNDEESTSERIHERKSSMILFSENRHQSQSREPSTGPAQNKSSVVDMFQGKNFSKNLHRRDGAHSKLEHAAHLMAGGPIRNEDIDNLTGSSGRSRSSSRGSR